MVKDTICKIIGWNFIYKKFAMQSMDKEPLHLIRRKYSQRNIAEGYK